MRILHALALLLALPGFMLAGCDDHPTTALAQSTPVPVSPSPDAGIGERFACDAGVTVMVVGKQAQAYLPDGSQAKLSLIADSMPPVFTGDGLYFRIDGGRTHLSQADGPELACHPDGPRR